MTYYVVQLTYFVQTRQNGFSRQEAGEESPRSAYSEIQVTGVQYGNTIALRLEERTLRILGRPQVGIWSMGELSRTKKTEEIRRCFAVPGQGPGENGRTVLQ